VDEGGGEPIKSKSSGLARARSSFTSVHILFSAMDEGPSFQKVFLEGREKEKILS